MRPVDAVRVYAESSVRFAVYNSSKKITEKFRHIFFLEGKNQKQAKSDSGDIAAWQTQEPLRAIRVCMKNPPSSRPVEVPPPIMFRVEAEIPRR